MLVDVSDPPPSRKFDFVEWIVFQEQIDDELVLIFA